VSALKHLRRELRRALRHYRSSIKARRLAAQSGLKINFGCGPDIRTGWVNVDHNKGADYRFDLRRSIPLPDGCCALAYSEHFLEHLEYPDALHFISECYRLLQPGGQFSVGVPDATPYMQAYMNGDADGLFSTDPQSSGRPAWCVTPMEHVNYHFRLDDNGRLDGHGHRYAYDFETLSKRIAECGFINVRRRGFDPALDNAERALGTLYIDADKPSMQS
jgi:predicted SAM-dependent methyltransferase